jgi:hypothetical protein
MDLTAPEGKMESWKRILFAKIARALIGWTHAAKQ